MGNLVVNAMGLQLWKMGNIFKPLLLFRNRECASITIKPDPSSTLSVLQLRNITKKVYSLELESAQTPIFAFKRFSLERLLVPGVLGWVRSPLLNRWLSSHYNSPMGGGILSWTPVIIRIILRHWSQNNKNYKIQTHVQNYFKKNIEQRNWPSKRKHCLVCEWRLSWS